MKWTVLFLLMIKCAFLHAQTITISNSPGSTWTVSSPTSAITNAGKNYDPAIETSGENHTLITVNAILAWTVSVRQSTTANWDSSLKLYVRRSGSGTGGAILTGDLLYIQLSNNNQALFGGVLNVGVSRQNVPIQYKIEGLSVTLPAKTYTTTILYTISGI